MCFIRCFMNTCVENRKKGEFDMKIEVIRPECQKKILCMPGLFMSGDCFEPLAVYLQEYSLVMVTYNAHDEGTWFNSFDNEVEEIASRLRQMNLSDFDIVLGTSIGAILSIKLLEERCIQAKKLVLDGLKSYRVGKKEAAGLYIQFVLFKLISACHIDFLRCIYSKEWAKKMGVCARNMSWESLKRYVNDFASLELTEPLPKHSTVLFGEKEQHNGENRKHLAAVSPNTEIIVKQKHDHLTFLDQYPETYAKMLQDIFA